MTDATHDPLAITTAMVADLHRLVEALDRRVPHLERLGEAKIAHDSAQLREQALLLIAQLESKITPR
jgi:hypothetical protein